jgi:hypothetical protein
MKWLRLRLDVVRLVVHICSTMASVCRCIDLGHAKWHVSSTGADSVRLSEYV